MAAEFNIPAEAHRLELTGREHLTVSGVEDVERFDETGVVMSTAAGMLVVTGEDLQAILRGRRTVRGRTHRLHRLRGCAEPSGGLFQPPVRLSHGNSDHGAAPQLSSGNSAGNGRGRGV